MIDKNGLKRLAMFSIHSDPLAAIGSHGSGGQNVYVYNLAFNLDKLGWAVDIFTRLDDAKKKIISYIGKHSRVIRLKVGEPSYIQKGNLHSYFPEIYQKFLEFINFQDSYNVFHGHHYDGGYLAVKACQSFKKPMVINFHSLGGVRFKTQQLYKQSFKEEKILEERLIIEKEIIEKSSKIISLAETEKRDLNLLYHAPLEKIAIIPGGVNLKQFFSIDKNIARGKINLSKEKFILLFVGRLEWRKGVGTLISAIKLLKEVIPQINLVIVGGKIFGLRKNKDDWQEYQRLLKKVEEENVREYTRFIGRVDQSCLKLFYSSADIVVIPSYYEPFGLVALEAMATQRPVIASRKGGLRLIIKEGESGLLFEPRNSIDLKNQVLKIYQSSILANQLVKNAYQSILEKYSWGKVANQINDIYQSLI